MVPYLVSIGYTVNYGGKLVVYNIVAFDKT